MKTLTEIQEEHSIWAAKNFPSTQLWQPTLGVAEEAGELCHAVLKLSQGIRTNEDHEEALKDSIGDITTYLLHICSLLGYNFKEIINDTWETVSKRDWTINKEKGIKE